MTAPTLPVELQPWADALGVLDIDLAIGLGPVVRTLDALLGTRVDMATAAGERDGWSGITNHGDPDRLLVSEWLLAQELPEEFLRRAVSSELLHLAPAFRDDTPKGRMVCVADVGPDQLGAGRIVQLAALVVLVRRALALGTELRLGLAAGDEVHWLDGPFELVGRQWLRGRSPVPPDPGVVREALDAVAADPGGRSDEVWLLCGPSLAAHLRGRPRTVVSHPVGWDDDGVRTVSVRVEHRDVRVDLPPTDVTVRALRGGGFRDSSTTPAPVTDGTAELLWPAFAGPPRRFVGRTADPRVLVTREVDARRVTRYKQHGFSAPVVAAGLVGPRVVALLDVGHELEVQVVGRPLGGLHAERWPRPAVGPFALDGPPEPLVLVDRQLLWRHEDLWWRITPEGIAPADGVVAVGWSADHATPRVLDRDAWPGDVAPAARDATTVLVGPRRAVAWTHDDRTWVVVGARSEQVELDAGERPLGLAVVAASVGLVTESATRQVVRFRRPGVLRTYTRLSGAGPTHRSLHPTRPWLLVHRGAGTYVVDLETDTVITRGRGT